MILAPLLGTALIITVATDPLIDTPRQANLSTQERAAATEPLVRSATDCIVRAVVGSPRYGGSDNAAELGDLVVASMPPCLAPVRAMINAYDRYYGAGAGEAFFMGPYLDVLPRAVIEAAKKVRR